MSEENVETSESEDGGGEDIAPKKSKKMLFIIVGAVVVLALAGGGAYFFLFSGSSGDPSEEVVTEEASYYYDLPTMTVNLNSDSDEFLKLSVSLELKNEEMAQEVEPRIARVVDAFQVYLRELRRSDLEGSAGIYRLKEELRRRVNLAIYPGEVDGILFKEILVQ